MKSLAKYFGLLADELRSAHSISERRSILIVGQSCIVRITDEFRDVLLLGKSRCIRIADEFRTLFPVGGSCGRIHTVDTVSFLGGSRNVLITWYLKDSFNTLALK